MISTRPFYVVAVLCAAAGVALRLTPVSAPAFAAPAPFAATGPAAPARPPSSDTLRYAAIVASNAFSASRTAPATRLVPEGLRQAAKPAARAARKPAEFTARLFGITRGPGGAVALIDADPAVPGAEVYRIGDTVRGGRVTAIGDSTVTLSRPSGRLVLRLPDAGDRR